MEIKSKLPRSDFAINIIFAREGDTDALHKIMMSFCHMIPTYRRIHNETLREDLHAAAWEGLIQGICRGLDGRIPLTELYDRLGPYTSMYIRAHVIDYWEKMDMIRVPRTSKQPEGFTKPTVRSLHAAVEGPDGEETYYADMVAAPEEDDGISAKEIIHLLSTSEREHKILEGLRDGKRQIDLAKETGISPQMISIIVAGLRERGYRMGLDNVHHR